MNDVAIIGAGAAGLAVAGALADRQPSLGVIVLERAAVPGSSWIDRMPGLRLNTERRSSSIAGMTAPASMGRWPTGNDYSAYLRTVASRLAVDVRTATAVTRIDQTDHGAWSLAVDGGEVVARAVVIATGKDKEPVIPQWPGLTDAGVDVVHAADIDRLEHYRDRRVVVVGAGNTGTELSHQLADVGADVHIAVKERPIFVRRNIAGIPLTWLSRLLSPAPDRLLDVIGPRFQRLLFGDLEPVGLGPPDMALSEVRHRGSGPVVDDGFIAAVRNHQITVHDAFVGLDGRTALFAADILDDVDVLIAATGYRTGLRALIGHLVALDDDERPTRQISPHLRRGLYLAGFTQSLTAFLPEFDAEARWIAADLAAGL